MGDTHRDPTDHYHTTNTHAGETFIDPYCWPGLASIALGIISLAGCLAAAAYQRPEWVLTTGIVGVLAIAGGIAWLVVEHHRVLGLESHWRTMHPDVRPDRPSRFPHSFEPLPQGALFRLTSGDHPVNHAPLQLGR